MTLSEILLGQLGTKPSPLGWQEVALVLAALTLVGSVEFLLAGTLRLLLSRAWRRIRSEFDRANRSDTGGD